MKSKIQEIENENFILKFIKENNNKGIGPFAICQFKNSKKISFKFNFDYMLTNFENIELIFDFNKNIIQCYMPNNNINKYLLYLEESLPKKDNNNFNLNKNNYNDLIKKVKIYKQKKENLNNDKNSIKNKKDNKKEISKIEDDKNNNLNNNSNIFVEKMYNSLFIKRHENVEKEINNLKIKNDNNNKPNNNKTLSKSSNKISLDNNYFYNYLRNSNYNNITTKNKK